MSQQLAGKQVPVSEKLVPPQRIDAAGTRRALFTSEMTCLLVPVGFLLMLAGYCSLTCHLCKVADPWSTQSCSVTSTLPERL